MSFKGDRGSKLWFCIFFPFSTYHTVGKTLWRLYIQINEQLLPPQGHSDSFIISDTGANVAKAMWQNHLHIMLLCMV